MNSTRSDATVSVMFANNNIILIFCPSGQYLDDDNTENVTVLERALGEYVALTCKQKDEDEFSEEVTSYESDIRRQV